MIFSSDRPAFQFGTKATTLERLAPLVSKAKLCEQTIVPAAVWKDGKQGIIEDILKRFENTSLAVRSSARHEDGWDGSQAGAHLTHTHVEAMAAPLASSIDEVFNSYRHPSKNDQVLIQPMVGNVAISGVVLTRDLDTGSPYFVVNYDDFSGRTDTVTSGGESKTILVHRARPDALKSSRFQKLIASVMEIESVTGEHELDIEFCITGEEEVYILQVRPLAARKKWQTIPDPVIDAAIDQIRTGLISRMKPAPGLAGATTIMGEMPDWNPAEMIGNAPHPLALSLYKTLITDKIWAEARANMGYRRVEGPLLVDFHGRPYIDVRLSLNSFLPSGIGEDLAHRLIDYQLALLKEQPDFHDKIEFEIAITCRDFAFASQRERLKNAGFCSQDAGVLEAALSRVTLCALKSHKSELDRLLGLTEKLLRNQPGIDDLPPLEKIETLLANCRKFGTLPFSILARHGFIGVQFLKSLIRRGVFSQTDADCFMQAIHTVASDLVIDMRSVGAGVMDQDTFLARYGHLRPGTYDILSWRYDENPELFLGHVSHEGSVAPKPFEPSPTHIAGIQALLEEFGYDLEAKELLGYIASAIRAREQAKFAFARSISEALSVLTAWGEKEGLSREDLSFLPVESFVSGADVKDLQKTVDQNREAYKITRAIRLPHLIRVPSDIDVVSLQIGQPTFITGKAVTAKTSHLTLNNAPEDGHIVLIESADPGFDWIFSHDIAGLITKYGGANSHMAIRCAEFGLPAAIGCGEKLFEKSLKASVIELNCASRKINCQ